MNDKLTTKIPYVSQCLTCGTEEMDYDFACECKNLSIIEYDQEVGRLTAENAKLVEALEETKELWELAAPELDAIATANFKVSFIALHKPIEEIQAALERSDER